VTHTEAAALYPLREPFGKAGKPEPGEWGQAFGDARDRADALGLSKVEKDGRHDHGEAGGPDGVILPGLSDDDPPVPRLARWLGAVTLYYRLRAAAVPA
jgi:hypothetical protein